VAPDLFFCAKAFCLMDACTVTKWHGDKPSLS
jgi:hypothetical protein